MKIETARVPVEGLEIEIEEPSSIMEMRNDRYCFNTSIQLNLKASLIGTTLYVTGAICTTVDMRCDRCLELFERQVGNKKYIFEKQVKYPGEIIDLTPSIREDTILNLPVRLLCREDCRGLCPQCGGNLNKKQCGCKTVPISRAFSALDKLKTNKDKNSV